MRFFLDTWSDGNKQFFFLGLIENIRSDPTHLHGFQLLVLLP